MNKIDMLIRIVIVVIVLSVEVASHIMLSKRKVKKKVKPDLVGYTLIKGEKWPNYQCECGYFLPDEFKYCPCCGGELQWDKLKSNEWRIN